MVAIALSKEFQDRLGKQSEKLTDLGRRRLRKLAVAQAKTDDFHLDCCPELDAPLPEQLTKNTPIIELAGLPTARSGVFLKWVSGDRTRCLIRITSGFGEGLVVVSDRRCLQLQRVQLSLF